MQAVRQSRDRRAIDADRWAQRLENAVTSLRDAQRELRESQRLRSA